MFKVGISIINVGSILFLWWQRQQCPLTSLIILGSFSSYSVKHFFFEKILESMCTSINAEFLFILAKLSFHIVKLNFTSIKLNYTSIKLNFTCIKLNYTSIKLNFTINELDYLAIPKLNFMLLIIMEFYYCMRRIYSILVN